MKRQLLVGCGNRTEKRLFEIDGQKEDRTWESLVRLDHDKGCNPDVLWDLNEHPLPFPDNEFDEIHAYDVLEHCWAQGDYKAFFALFSEFWRILKDGGKFYGIVPAMTSEWLWGDPGHSCVINSNTISFLNQKMYNQIGKSSMTDYRSIYKADFELSVHGVSKDRDYWFVLRANKGGRE